MTAMAPMAEEGERTGAVRPSLVPRLMLAALLASLAGLLAAFLLTLTVASRHFTRAAVAQGQLAAVSRIGALAAIGFPEADVRRALADYRRSIASETALLPLRADTRRGQEEELAAADRLARLALSARPGDRLQLVRLVTDIAAREQDEVATVGVAMTRLHRRMALLAILLAIGALAAAVTGALALVGANRNLGRLVEARTADLRAVDRSRRLFFAKASHELRTPVTAMRGEAEVSLADAGASPADLRASLTHILAEADFLGRRIDELLGLSKADDGRLSLTPVPVDLVGLVRATVETAEGYARSAEVVLALEAPSGSLAMAADPRWLGQALLAIIDNGVKFSPQGGRLDVTLVDEGARARITVADHGPGVMADALPRIFDAYYQTEEGRMRGGTGLGLALARWVVERHGGTIVAANAAGGGCRITLHLPLEKAS